MTNTTYTPDTTQNTRHETSTFMRIGKAALLALTFVAAAKAAVGVATIGAGAYVACCAAQALKPAKETKEAVPSTFKRGIMAFFNPLSVKLEKRGPIDGDEFATASVKLFGVGTMIISDLSLHTVSAHTSMFTSHQGLVGLLGAALYVCGSALALDKDNLSGTNCKETTKLFKPFLKQLANPFSLHL